ncbi:MAG: glycoside hydrolase family 31 protein [Oscillospiraceae bacterium]|nr:glycoside hydrolase family 31 protein [Oscillospiraceae bacterium]
MIKKYTFGNPIETNATVIDISETKGTLEFFERDNNTFILRLAENDIVYGLGQQVRGLNKRGWKYASNNLDNPNHEEDTLSLYGTHNFIIISGDSLFGAFFDYAGIITFDIGYTHRNLLTVTPDDDNLDVYIITGENETDIVRQFRNLTGRSYAAPKWAFGYGQSRWGYKNADDVRAVAESYRNNNIPIDSIYLDIDYMERYKDFTVDNDAFPDFSGLTAEMKKQGIRLVPIIDAGVKIEDGYDVYEEGVKQNYFCKDADGNDFVAAVWPGRVHFPDVLNSDARKWFGEKYDFLIKQGIEGFWNDMNEPAIFYTEKRLESSIEKINELAKTNMGINEYFELKDAVNSLANNPDDYKLFYHNIDGKKVRHDKVHNLFGFNMTRAASEAFDKICPNKRILMFSRSSCAGMHRYGGMWQGDNKSWWSHLLMNIQMTCNLNMVGFLYTGADMGGFGCDTTEDLMLRWLQFSLFTPLMRNHSALGTREQEVYRFDNMESCRKMIEIRYALIPYLYSEYMKAVLNDDMMFRPLGFEFHDKFSRNTEDQLLLGNEIMLAPVYTQNAEGRYVWLPEEMMFVRMRSLNDYETEILPSGHHYISAKLDELVFFIRRNKAIPLCSAARCTDEIDMSTLHLFGYENSSYELYDDDGISKNISRENISTII